MKTPARSSANRALSATSAGWLPAVALAVAAALGSGSAAARSVQLDYPSFCSLGGTCPATSTSASASLAASDVLGAFALNFAPGTASTTAAEFTAPQAGYTDPNGNTVDNAFMFNWGPNPQSQAGGDIAEQVMVYLEGNVAVVDFNYFAKSCAGETASLSINGSVYTEANPCAGATNEFVLTAGVNGGPGTIGAPIDWKNGGTTVPEPPVVWLLALGALALAATRGRGLLAAGR